MFNAQNILYLYVETPLHAGTGSGLGVIDLPIQRERSTGYPMIQASGIKGKLRAEVDERIPESDQALAVFGPNTKGSDHAGAISVGDGRVLLFPVRSMMGVFAWVTSKYVLARYIRDSGTTEWEAIGPAAEDEALIMPDSDVDNNGHIILEEFSFKSKKSEAVKGIADWLSKKAFPVEDDYQFWREKLHRSLVILPDNAFRDFTLFSTEVVTRTKLDRKTKTVENGALWTEEHLPADTFLYSPIYASHSRKSEVDLTAKDVINFLVNLGISQMQLGGDETVGRGLVRLRWGGE